MTQSGWQSVSWSFIRSVFQSACQQVGLNLLVFTKQESEEQAKQDSGKVAFSRTYQNDVSIYLFFNGNKNLANSLLSVSSKRQL